MEDSINPSRKKDCLIDSPPHKIFLEKPPLRQLCKKYNIRFKKRLGQNLLLDDNIHRIMVDCADLTKDDAVIEVGAGLGALTWHLVQSVGELLAVEIDPSFIPCLNDRFGHLPHFKLFRGDILNHDLEDLVQQFIPNAKRYKMVSNLPYYITTPILFHFLESSIKFERIVVMVQYEVGLRMSAMPGNENYGVLTLAIQSLCYVDLIHFVPRTCFVPRPDVDSCIIRLRRIDPPLLPPDERKKVMKVIQSAFAHRRKTLKNALTHSPLLNINPEIALEALRQTGISPNQRAETLTWQDYVKLTKNIEQLEPQFLSIINKKK